MSRTHDRPTSVLERPWVQEVVIDGHAVAGPRQTAQRRASERPPAPLGWGSQAERRLVRQVLLFFAVLGLYAVGFVVLGSVVWT